MSPNSFFLLGVISFGSYHWHLFHFFGAFFVFLFLLKSSSRKDNTKNRREKAIPLLKFFAQKKTDAKKPYSLAKFGVPGRGSFLDPMGWGPKVNLFGTPIFCLVIRYLDNLVNYRNILFNIFR